jgi:hypothetical protein
MNAYTTTRVAEIKRQIIALGRDKAESQANLVTALQDIDTELGQQVINNGGTWPPTVP